jgi:hypothetical protein
MKASLPEIFDRERWALIPGIVVQPLLGFLWRHVLDREIAGNLSSDPDRPGTPVAYGDVVMEHMLERLRPQIEAAAGLRLHPTYSYLRLYKHGDVLKAHHDRPACEISLSLNIGQQPDGAWPLWIRAADGPQGIALQPGDGVLYRGIELEHWRDPYAGEQAAQVFLHYVDREGPHAEWKFDKRPSLAMSVRLPI